MRLKIKTKEFGEFIGRDCGVLTKDEQTDKLRAVHIALAGDHGLAGFVLVMDSGKALIPKSVLSESVVLLED